MFLDQVPTQFEISWFSLNDHQRPKDTVQYVNGLEFMIVKLSRLKLIKGLLPMFLSRLGISMKHGMPEKLSLRPLKHSKLRGRQSQ